MLINKFFSSAFSLIELMIVVAIIGILVAVGVPTYQGYLESTRSTNAKNNLRAIYLQQQEYFTENNQYYATGSACTSSASLINVALFAGDEFLQDSHYLYCIVQDNTNSFVAHATALSGKFDYTINNLGQVNF